MKPASDVRSVDVAPANVLWVWPLSAVLLLGVAVWLAGTLPAMAVPTMAQSALAAVVASPNDAALHRNTQNHAAGKTSDAILRVRYPHNDSNDTVYAYRIKYIEALLELALSHSGQPYALEAVSTQTVTGNRNSQNLLKGYYDVTWLHTTFQREEAFIPIRIPLFKGVTGWRIFLIHSDDQVRFKAINALDQLKALRAGLGHDWPDTPLMSSHSFAMQTSVGRDSLISMLAGRRIDYFPRSVTEAFEEVAMYQHENIEVEKSLALKYTTANYFFVAPGNKHLADVLTAGLEAAIACGDFDDLFQRFYGDSIARAKFSSRRIFTLSNPLLSKETPLDREELWLTPP